MNQLTIAKSVLIGLTASALSLPAFAGHRHADDGDEDGDGGVVYAKVGMASTNRHECRNERVVYRDYDTNRPNVAGSILGGILVCVAG